MIGYKSSKINYSKYKGGVIILKIGEFSKLSGISIFMLRHYDEMDLLKPISIDQNNSYRLYSEDQLIDARKIVVLKQFGYSLDEISNIIKSLDFEEIKKTINTKLMAKKQEFQRLEEQISSLVLTYQEMNSNNLKSLDFIVKEIPEMAVVSYRGIIHEYKEEGRLWKKLGLIIQEQGIKASVPPIYIAITHSYDRTKIQWDVEVQTRVVYNDNPIIIKKNKIKVASIVFKGEYNQLESLFPTIFDLIKKKGYVGVGKSFLMYLKSPNYEYDAQNFVTEICVPIK